jgi:3'-phosphoadenosine 5'-phosphosulfate (PAPS) 3'-phosphatase
MRRCGWLSHYLLFTILNYNHARIIGAALARPLYSSTRSGTTAFKRRSSRHTLAWIRQRRGGGGGGGPSLPPEDSSPTWTGMSATVTSDDDSGSSSSSGSSTLKQEVPDWEEDYNELPLDFPRRRDALVALAAVRKACAVTQRLQPIHPPNGSFIENNKQQETNNNNNNNNTSFSSSSLSSSSSGTIATVTKLDLSPVTVADFAAQALVLNHLYQTFGGGSTTQDSFIAEESSAALEKDAHLAELIWNATRHELQSIEQVKQSIELGKVYLSWTTTTTTALSTSSISSTTDQQQEKEVEEGVPRGEEITTTPTTTTTTATTTTNQRQRPRPKRVWCLDPIDGTKGFLRGKRPGGQYAVALALLEVRQLNLRALVRFTILASHSLTIDVVVVVVVVVVFVMHFIYFFSLILKKKEWCTYHWCLGMSQFACFVLFLLE